MVMDRANGGDGLGTNGPVARKTVLGPSMRAPPSKAWWKRKFLPISPPYRVGNLYQSVMPLSPERTPPFTQIYPCLPKVAGYPVAIQRYAQPRGRFSAFQCESTWCLQDGFAQRHRPTIADFGNAFGRWSSLRSAAPTAKRRIAALSRWLVHSPDKAWQSQQHG